jgi:hypothetical protein
MKIIACVLLCVVCLCAARISAATDQDSRAETAEFANRFARLALDCVHREYPNKIGHVLTGDADARTPSSLHPVFYGCFDWHSSVHGHWLLVRLLRTAEEIGLAPEIREQAVIALDRSFSAAAVESEVEYFLPDERKAFERPYGSAWFLQLMAELREWPDPGAKAWIEILEPLEAVIVAQIKSWLPRLAYPIRVGTHNQSMFAFGLILDWARAAGDAEMTELITQRSLAFHKGDRDCPIEYEPSGEDFLSPCLMEADLMRRILDRERFAAWLDGFLPRIPRNGAGDWLATGIVIDPSDGKLVHLDGVNLSRAWNLENIAFALPENDPRQASLLEAARIHSKQGVANVSGEHYEGSHWLASFATYLVTKRGQQDW